MTHASLMDGDWPAVVARLGGAAAVEASARETRAFVRARGFASAVDLLRMVLAYCLGGRGLRSTAAWAAAIGLADVSNVALLLRLRNCGDWLAELVGQALLAQAPAASRDRLIRIVDATAVPKAGAGAKRKNGVWRVHAAFDLPAERFGAFEVTGEEGGERLDRIPVVAGEIRIADRAHLQADRMAAVIAAGADVVVRTGWKSARWLDAEGRPADLVGWLAGTDASLIDRPIGLARKADPHPLALRLVAARKPPEEAETAKRRARQDARRGRHQLAPNTLVAAEWVLLVTSLPSDTYSARDILDLYRLRWRIELGFKRLKSQIGLNGPPAADPRSARPYLLAHLLMILLVEPLLGAFGDSPRRATA